MVDPPERKRSVRPGYHTESHKTSAIASTILIGYRILDLEALVSRSLNPTPPFLLPQPKQVHWHQGFCRVDQATTTSVRLDDARIAQAVSRWLRGSSKPPSQADGPVGPRNSSENLTQRCANILIVVDPQVVPHKEGYRLRITPDRVQLTGGSPVGCYWGLQTLGQLSMMSDSQGLPCCAIEDQPDFATRGLLHDVTRGRVPTLETLKSLVDRLSLMKINQLQLYIEHAFVFSFDPEICTADQGLTPDEIHQLDLYCKERYIDLVPALATLGHMGRILSMPTYRHLAEIEATKPWESMTWPQRLRGFTLDCLNPEAFKLIERMWSDVLDAFSSPVVNICGDEPWDLGKGKNRDRLGDRSVGEAYIEHIRKTVDLCASRGRKCQVWSDVVTHYPDLFHRLPNDLTILHWGYDDKSDYAGTKKFTDAGLDTIVCPGVSGWKRIINAIDLAERNISNFAQAGHKHGASGLLNTDWGDEGHFNLPACSLPGVALGAAKSWSVDHPTGSAFDVAYSSLFLFTDHAQEPNNTEGLKWLREASRLATSMETWHLFWLPRSALCDELASFPKRTCEFLRFPVPHDGVNRDATVRERVARQCTETFLESALVSLDRDEILQSQSHARALQQWCQSQLERVDADSPIFYDLSEWKIAAQFHQLFVDKIFLAISDNPKGEKNESLTTWTSNVRRALDQYSDIWLHRYKPSGLTDIRSAINLMLDSFLE